MYYLCHVFSFKQLIDGFLFFFMFQIKKKEKKLQSTHTHTHTHTLWHKEEGV